MHNENFVDINYLLLLLYEIQVLLLGFISAQILHMDHFRLLVAR